MFTRPAGGGHRHLLPGPHREPRAHVARARTSSILTVFPRGDQWPQWTSPPEPRQEGFTGVRGLEAPEGPGPPAPPVPRGWEQLKQSVCPASASRCPAAPVGGGSGGFWEGAVGAWMWLRGTSSAPAGLRRAARWEPIICKETPSQVVQTDALEP